MERPKEDGRGSDDILREAEREYVGYVTAAYVER